MNRTIKFRAWHALSKKMYFAEELAADQMALLPTGEFINVHPNPKLSEILPTHLLIPLQFTGLRDKNGTEIYEGDIVSYHLGEFRSVVRWDESLAGWKMPYPPLAESDVDFSTLKSNKPETKHSYRGLEVIGNIYDNSELLEESK